MDRALGNLIRVIRLCTWLDLEHRLDGQSLHQHTAYPLTNYPLTNNGHDEVGQGQTSDELGHQWAPNRDGSPNGIVRHRSKT